MLRLFSKFSKDAVVITNRLTLKYKNDIIQPSMFNTFNLLSYTYIGYMLINIYKV